MRSLIDIKGKRDRLRGLVVKASALQSEGPGFDSWPGHTKDFKNGTYTAVVRDAPHKQWSKGK